LLTRWWRRRSFGRRRFYVGAGFMFAQALAQLGDLKGAERLLAGA